MCNIILYFGGQILYRKKIILYQNHFCIPVISKCLISSLSEASGNHVLHIEPIYSHILESLNGRKDYLVKHGWFLLNNIYRILLAQHVYHLNNIDLLYDKNNLKEDVTLIHSWVDGRSFTDNNNFQDAYFGNLNNYMLENGKKVIIIPYILHTVSYTKTIRKLMDCKECFLIPSAYLSVSNILSILLKTLNKPKKKRYPKFENMDISDIIHLDRVNDWKDTRLSSNLLLYYTIKSLHGRKCTVLHFVNFIQT